MFFLNAAKPMQSRRKQERMMMKVRLQIAGIIAGTWIGPASAKRRDCQYVHVIMAVTTFFV